MKRGKERKRMIFNYDEPERKKLHRRRHLTPFQIIIMSFAGTILAGALLLMLPLSSAEGKVTPFFDALFTSTSAVCVTGLVVYDTASYWSAFGQSVLLFLIQIGGMGIITAVLSLIVVSGRKINLMHRSTIQEALAAPKAGGIVNLTIFVIKTIFMLEAAGALLLMPAFCGDFGMKRGIWLSVFHSISAFCNAGFDLMGTGAEFSSLTSYGGNVLINTVIMLLITVGGIGFITWDDIKENGFRLYKYRMQSKVVLCTSGVLIMIPAAYFFFCEFSDTALGERLLYSFFQSVTARTAGFNTADLTTLTGAGQLLLIMLMLMGGSPGSTAGGMKTTNIAVLFSAALSVFRKESYAHFFGRRIEDQIVRNAIALLMMYMALFLTGGMIISRVEGLPVMTCLFETASAVGTVGLSLGITPELGGISHIILMLLMFFGRVGGLTVIYAAVSGNRKTVAKLPQGKIAVG